jgi:hypothetical protein
MASFSAQGPAFDGRIKPDLVAPGQTILSAHSDGLPYSYQCGKVQHKHDSAVFELSGTSMATPFVAGVAALIRQYLREGWHPSAHSADNSLSVHPTAALLKALLIAGVFRPIGVDFVGLSCVIAWAAGAEELLGRVGSHESLGRRPSSIQVAFRRVG